MTIPTNVAGFYTLVVAADNAARPPTFTATATPTGGQAKDTCATLTINQGGMKTASGTGSCW